MRYVWIILDVCALELTQSYVDLTLFLSVSLLPHQNRLLPSKSQAATLQHGVFRAHTFQLSAASKESSDSHIRLLKE